MTDTQILDLIDLAGYGIGYWAHNAVIDPQNRTYTIYSEDLEEPAVIGFDQIAEVANRYNLQNIDAEDADAVIQVAVFGETVFG